MRSNTGLRATLARPDLFVEKMYINGQFVDAASKKTLPVVNPATEEIIGSVPMGGSEDTRQAIDAAYTALPKWARVPVRDRCEIVRKWGELMMQNQADLAKILTTEQGKAFEEAKGEIAYAAGFLDFFGKVGEDYLQDDIIMDTPEKTVKAVKAPVGVVGAITPWNFPSAMITRKAGAAFVAGCTGVFKPSELTPYSAFALAKLGEEAGLPAGVFNVVTGDAATIGQELTDSTKVQKITFTGSTRVGKLLLGQSANKVKRVSMELGGNAPFIICADADIERALQQTIAAKLRNAGQTCVTPNRFIVHRSIAEKFANQLAEAFRKIKIGNGLAPGVTMGPLINTQAVEKVKQQVDDARSKGAKILCGGEQPKLDGLSSQRFYLPTVIYGATPEMRCFNEETFGPLAPIFVFDTLDEAIQLANNTRAGLAAYAFSEDPETCERLQNELEYGMVAINQGSVSLPSAPFGGVKESGIGREGSKYGLDEYITIKAVHITKTPKNASKL